MGAKAVKRHVTTVELSDFKLALAAKNFERSGLAPFIKQVHGEAGALLRGSSESSFDVVFLDSERSEYVGWWPDIKRVLRMGRLLVVDNATSHSTEVAPFATLVSADFDFTTCTVPVWNGEFLATRVLFGHAAQLITQPDLRKKPHRQVSSTLALKIKEKMKQVNSITEYIQSFPIEIQTILIEMRTLIQKAAPKAAEKIEKNRK